LLHWQQPPSRNQTFLLSNSLYIHPPPPPVYGKADRSFFSFVVVIPFTMNSLFFGLHTCSFVHSFVRVSPVPSLAQRRRHPAYPTLPYPTPVRSGWVNLIPRPSTYPFLYTYPFSPIRRNKSLTTYLVPSCLPSLLYSTLFRQQTK
jgi:hypothetical protein